MLNRMPFKIKYCFKVVFCIHIDLSSHAEDFCVVMSTVAKQCY